MKQTYARIAVSFVLPLCILLATCAYILAPRSALDGSPVKETATVNVVPVFQEL